MTDTLETQEAPKKEYFFKKGNKYGAGQPLSSKKQMEFIRRRILRVVRRRIMHEKDLSTVSTTDLLKFVSTIMPKDYSLAVKPELNYVSNIPREELPEAPKEALPFPIEDTTITRDSEAEPQPLEEPASQNPS